MVISFSGPHSTGKTTLLNQLRKMQKFKNYKFIDQITRKISSKGLPINEMGNIETQINIMVSHYINIFVDIECNKVLDRCALDGLVYTEYLYHNKKVDYHTILFAHNIFNMLYNYYDIIFYIEPEFNIVNDGVRSTEAQFQSDILNIFRQKKDQYKYKLNIVQITGSVQKRLDTILQEIEEYKC